MRSPIRIPGSMADLLKRLDSLETLHRPSSSRSIGGESIKARIENNVLYSPYRPVDIPVCSVYTAVKGFLRAEPGSAIAVLDARKGLTRSDLLTMIERYAAGFQKLGIKPFDHVCVHLRNSVDCLVVVFGIIFAGATVVLSNARNNRDELVYRMRDGEAAYVITDMKNAQKVRDACDVLKLPEEKRLALSDAPGFTSIAGFEVLDEEAFVELPISDPRNRIAAIVYTSGTTGPPKGIEVTHYSFVANLFQNRTVLASNEEEVYLAWNPITHVSGFFFTMLAACIGFKCVVVPSTLTFHKFEDICHKHKVTWMTCLPARLAYLTRNMELMNVRMRSVRTLCVSGSGMTEELARTALTVFPCLRQFRNIYSLSECCGLVTASSKFEISSNDLGFPTPNVELKFLNLKTREPVGPMEHGEIIFRSPTTMRGYYKRPQETAKILDSEGWCLTGDLGYYEKSGRVHYVERLSELIKCMDNLVVPCELEERILQKCPGVGDVGVVGIPDPDYGEIPTAFVVLKEGWKGKVTEDDIKITVSDALAEHKRLGAVYFCDFLPHTETGTVRRSALREDPRFRCSGESPCGALTADSHSATDIELPTEDNPIIPVTPPSPQDFHSCPGTPPNSPPE